MKQKDAKIKELQDSVAAIEKKWLITGANREQTAKSEAVVEKKVGMTEQMQKDAISLAKQAFQNYDNLPDMAKYISVEFEKKHGGKWQCNLGITGSEQTRYYSKTYSITFDLGAYWI